MYLLSSFAQEGSSRFSFTPGFSRVIRSLKRRGNRLNGSSLSLAQFTWLKPGVNEIGLSPNEFDSLRCRNRLFVQSSLEPCHACVRNVDAIEDKNREERL